jgi:hypoxanthine phosphoribosyltransferase
VVGIARAGAIPGAVIASILRVDFCSMTISRRDGVEQVRENPTLRFVAPVSARGQRVLIVDETSSSGETLRMATAFICPQGYKPDFFLRLRRIRPTSSRGTEKSSRITKLVANPRYRAVLDE